MLPLPYRSNYLDDVLWNKVTVQHWEQGLRVRPKKIHITTTGQLPLIITCIIRHSIKLMLPGASVMVKISIFGFPRFGSYFVHSRLEEGVWTVADWETSFWLFPPSTTSSLIIVNTWNTTCLIKDGCRKPKSKFFRKWTRKELLKAIDRPQLRSEFDHLDFEPVLRNKKTHKLQTTKRPV